MEPEKEIKKTRKVPWVLGGMVLVTFTFLILLQSSSLWRNLSVETATDTLLLYALSSLNFIALIVFSFIFLRSILKLVRERRMLLLGSQIKTRMLLYFFGLSLLPILAMAAFSFLFMNRALDRWFTQIPDNVIHEAREIQGQSLLDRSAKLDESARMIAATIADDRPSRDALGEIAGAGNLVHIGIISSSGEPIVSYEREVSVDLKPELDRLLAAAQTGDGSDPTMSDGKGLDVAVAGMSEGRKLVVVPDPFGDRTVSQIVENSVSQFELLKERQLTVRQVGLLTLGVLTFLLIFISSWLALYIARGLTVPIQALAVGAEEIARGNLSHRVETQAEDELAILVSAFNEMSSKLEANSAELSTRKRYIETILETLPTGVISFDAANKVGTINRSAINILTLEDADFAGFDLVQLVGGENLSILERLLARAKRVGRASEQTQLRREVEDGSSLSNSDLTVALSATALPAEKGVVLVIEDLSELIAAQRASAWQEVARRMAHEIKNPLTPIQLSAERIAKRFSLSNNTANGGSKHPEDRGPIASVVEESTRTILREVSSLKTMVDEFSRFARLPDVRPEPGNLNEVIEQLILSNRGRFVDVSIATELADDLPDAMLDGEQMTRVFVNLIENAVEAFDPTQADKDIKVKTRHDIARDLIVVEVADNGRGIALADLQKLFQPYFSTKGRGTGLGLAIVSRIVTEHGGKINVAANPQRGAKFIIEIPVSV